MSAARVFLVEDHPTMRDTVTRLLARIDGIEVAGAAESTEEALEAIPRLAPDLVLVDVSLPGRSGIELVREIASPEGPACLMLSGHIEASYVRSSALAGARGYVPKGDPRALIDAIRAVLVGDTWFGSGKSGEGTLR